MTEPIKPPTEDGWYVVEYIWRDKAVIYFNEGNGMTWESMSGWVDFDWNHVNRYTGPLDLEKLLDEGGER